ncbi:MAG: hypothetical protein F4Y68_05405 [Boseongicola sp. SB0665_bin_10]|nr:hypothetical protein [Boseongicola sp. SB0665_bin_10]
MPLVQFPVTELDAVDGPFGNFFAFATGLPLRAEIENRRCVLVGAIHFAVPPRPDHGGKLAQVAKVRLTFSLVELSKERVLPVGFQIVVGKDFVADIPDVRSIEFVQPQRDLIDLPVFPRSPIFTLSEVTDHQVLVSTI